MPPLRWSSPKAAAPVTVPPRALEAAANDLAAAAANSNAYIELMNRFLRAVDSWNRQTSWVNVNMGPTGKGRYIDYGLYGLYGVNDEIAKSREAIGNTPETPELDAAFQRSTEAGEVRAPPITKTEGYYERKDCKSDKMVEGWALYAKLVPAAEAFLKSRAEVETLMRACKRDLDAKSLAAIAVQEGQRPNWHMKAVMMHAQDVIEQLRRVRSQPT